MNVSIYIPLKPHLIKYMEVEAKRPNGTYKVLVNSIFGNFILGMLEPTPEGAKVGPPDIDHLEFLITERFTEGRGRYISPQNMELIVRMISHDYHSEFMLFVTVHNLKHGYTYRVATLKWRERYGITEDDRKLETDLKNIYRKKPLKMSNNE